MAFPTAIPDLAVRFLAADLTLADQASVSSWASNVGGSTATQATAAAQPVYHAAGLGGKPSVHLDGVDDVMSATDGAAVTYISGLAAQTMFVVRQRGADTTVRSVVVTNTGGGTLRFGQQLATNWRDAIRNSAGTVTTLLMAGTAVTTPVVTTSITDWAGGIVKLYENGTLGIEGTIAAGTLPVENSTAMRLGSNSGASGEWWLGHIAEVIVYKRVLTDAERAEVHSYVQDTYGITVADYVSSVATTTYRPTSTVTAGGWTTTEASLHGAISDQSNTTIITGTGA